MAQDLKKRILTSFALLSFLFFAFINNYVLGYILMIISIFSILEFLRITKIFLKKNKILRLLINLIFIFYILYFSTLLFYLYV